MSYGQYSDNHKERSNPLRNVSTSTESTGETKRVKQVHPSHEIPHLWAHQTQTSARNATGNFYFSGRTIYSYGSHFPIATIQKSQTGKHAGESAYILTTRTYSNTTAKHISCVRGSIPKLAVCFHVALESRAVEYSGEVRHTSIIEAYQAEIKHKITAAGNARSRRWQLLLDAHHERAEMLRYVEFFGLPEMSERARKADRKIPVIPEPLSRISEEIRKIDARKDELRATRDARAAAKRAADDQRWIEAHPERQRLHAEGMSADEIRSHFRNLKAEEKEAAWRAGHVDSLNYPYVSWGRPTILRVSSDGETVETSRGANFPIAHARRGLALVRAVMARGEEWQTNGHTCHLGHYRIDRIEANGTVHAGCHVVEWPEIERIAPELDKQVAGAEEGGAA